MTIIPSDAANRRKEVKLRKSSYYSTHIGSFVVTKMGRHTANSNRRSRNNWYKFQWAHIYLPNTIITDYQATYVRLGLELTVESMAL